jgi:DNA-directed RNA polymerase subunit RPC12/RpoP
MDNNVPQAKPAPEMKCIDCGAKCTEDELVILNTDTNESAYVCPKCWQQSVRDVYGDIFESEG